MFVLTTSLVSAQVDPISVSWFHLTDEPADLVALNPDGTRIAIRRTNEPTLLVFNWRTKELIWQTVLQTEILYSCAAACAELAWSADGQYIALLSQSGTIALFQAGDGQRLTSIESQLIDFASSLIPPSLYEDTLIRFSDMQWSSQASQLAIMIHGYIVIYDFSSGEVKSQIDLVIVPNDELHESLSSFAWSPDDSTIAAFHFRLSEGQPVFPLEVVVGFWTIEGQWLREYADEAAVASQESCVRNGDEIFAIAGRGPIGGQIQWLSNNIIAVRIYSRLGISNLICELTPEDENTLVATTITGFDPVRIWNDVSDRLFTITPDCSLYVLDTQSYQVSQTIPFEQPCYYQFSTWNSNTNVLALATDSGVWIGRF